MSEEKKAENYHNLGGSSVDAETIKVDVELPESSD